MASAAPVLAPSMLARHRCADARLTAAQNDAWTDSTPGGYLGPGRARRSTWRCSVVRSLASEGNAESSTASRHARYNAWYSAVATRAYQSDRSQVPCVASSPSNTRAGDALVMFAEKYLQLMR